MRSNTSLQVHCPRGLSRTTIAPSLPRLLQQHRHLRVGVQAYDRLCDVPLTASRVVLSTGEIPYGDLIAYTLCPVRLVTCASAEFLAVNGMPRQPCDLDPRHCIQVCREQGAAMTGWEFRRGSDRKEITPASEMAFSDEASAAVAAMRGGGFVQLPKYEVDEALASGLLTEVLAEWSVSRMLTLLVHRHAAAERARADVLLRFLRTVLPAHDEID